MVVFFTASFSFRSPDEPMVWGRLGARHTAPILQEQQPIFLEPNHTRVKQICIAYPDAICRPTFNLSLSRLVQTGAISTWALRLCGLGARIGQVSYQKPLHRTMVGALSVLRSMNSPVSRPTMDPQVARNCSQRSNTFQIGISHMTERQLR